MAVRDRLAFGLILGSGPPPRLVEEGGASFNVLGSFEVLDGLRALLAR